MGGYPTHIQPIDRLTPKNRKYWKLQDLLYEELPLPVELMFEINRCQLMYHIGFVKMAHCRNSEVPRPSKWLEIAVMKITPVAEIEVRVGIVRKSGKEIVVSNAQVMPPGKQGAVIRLIRRSKLQKIMNSYKELELFWEMDEKDEQREEKNKYCK